ncbi:NAD-P-binding protein [Artomyces pyxidatus]|uniref:NAD-P-binding protein n=1 Tax=Artomyces pyxidatus TaxID=48021 RepID=A0ACB8THG9_9AGAM|nr:NAD-P-binding protein [Artomyces pyxidatus]
MSSESKVWFITGASSGLGLALTRRALARGEFVIATARGNLSTRFADLLASLDAEQTARLHTLALDVRAPYAEIEQVVRGALGVWGRVDVLVCNAAIGGLGVAEEIGHERISDIVRTNLTSVADLTNAVLPYMRARRDGTILIIGSRSGYKNDFPGVAAYSASKAAVHAYGEGLAAEVQAFNVRVHVVIPGTFNTSIATRGVIGTPMPDYAGARAHMDGIVRALRAMPGKSDPERGMDVLVDVVRREGRAKGLENPPLWLFLGEDAVRDLRVRMERLAEAVDGSWGQIGFGLR